MLTPLHFQTPTSTSQSLSTPLSPSQHLSVLLSLSQSLSVPNTSQHPFTSLSPSQHVSTPIHTSQLPYHSQITFLDVMKSRNLSLIYGPRLWLGGVKITLYICGFFILAYWYMESFMSATWTSMRSCGKVLSLSWVMLRTKLFHCVFFKSYFFK